MTTTGSQQQTYTENSDMMEALYTPLTDPPHCAEMEFFSFQQLRKLMLEGHIFCPDSQLLSDRALFCFESQFL